MSVVKGKTVTSCLEKCTGQKIIIPPVANVWDYWSEFGYQFWVALLTSFSMPILHYLAL